MPTKEVIRQAGITEQTFYRWKNKYGGMEVSDAKKLRGLEEENRRLKQLVAEQALEIQIPTPSQVGKPANGLRSGSVAELRLSFKIPIRADHSWIRLFIKDWGHEAKNES